jgi:hypothetical protein
MERAKKARTPLRMALTKTINEVEAELANDPPDHGILQDRIQGSLMPCWMQTLKMMCTRPSIATSRIIRTS